MNNSSGELCSGCRVLGIDLADQLLKFSGVADIGSEAKQMVLDGIVKVNGEVCTMRGKKIRPGDIVEITGEDIIIRLEVVGE